MMAPRPRLVTEGLKPVQPLGRDKRTALNLEGTGPLQELLALRMSSRGCGWTEKGRADPLTTMLGGHLPPAFATRRDTGDMQVERNPLQGLFSSSLKSVRETPQGTEGGWW